MQSSRLKHHIAPFAEESKATTLNPWAQQTARSHLAGESVTPSVVFSGTCSEED